MLPPGPTQTDAMTRAMIMTDDRYSRTSMNPSSMQISISPRTDAQSPITLEVQQGATTKVFNLPTESLDPNRNYYVSLSIKPTPSPTKMGMTGDPPCTGEDDGSISAPPPPAELDNDDMGNPLSDRDNHNKSM